MLKIKQVWMIISLKLKRRRSSLFYPGIFTPVFYLYILQIIFLSACDTPIEAGNEKQVTDNNELIIAWNQLAVEIADGEDKFLTFKGVRALAMTHIAMHDALNAVMPKYEQYAFKNKKHEADAKAAAAQSAYEVLLKLYPSGKQRLDSLLQKWLDNVSDIPAKESGIQLGKETAAAILNFRLNDGYDAGGDYQPGTDPGDYNYTGDFTWVLSPDFRFAKPFSLKSPDQFRSSPPPDLSSTEYAEDYDEVKLYGKKNGSARTEDQTNYAHWWAEFAEHGWNRIGRITASEKKLPLWETARMFAFINMDIFDIYLACFDSKYFYGKWRPVTAIRYTNDGNSNTIPDKCMGAGNA